MKKTSLVIIFLILTLPLVSVSNAEKTKINFEEKNDYKISETESKTLFSEENDFNVKTIDFNTRVLGIFWLFKGFLMLFGSPVLMPIYFLWATIFFGIQSGFMSILDYIYKIPINIFWGSYMILTGNMPA